MDIQAKENLDQGCQQSCQGQTESLAAPGWITCVLAPVLTVYIRTCHVVVVDLVTQNKVVRITL